MRAGIAAILMGVGGILISFGTVVIVLSFFARQGDTRLELPAMATLTTVVLVVGAVMFGAGLLLGRVGRSSAPIRNS